MLFSSAIILLLGLATFDTIKSKKCRKVFPPTEFLQKSFLGFGATGNVYKAKIMGGKTVALKRFNEWNEDAANEASKAMSISHKNVAGGVCWIEHKEHNRGTLDLAMQFIDGKNVYDLMYREANENDESRTMCPKVHEMSLVPLKIDYETIFQVAHGVLCGLSAIHKKHFIHADIKPQNIMIRTEDGRVKIIDLGSMRTSPSADPIGTTLEYCSPEVLRKKFDQAADFWALAVTLYEMAHPCHMRPYDDEVDAFLKSVDKKTQHQFGEFPWSSVVPEDKRAAGDGASLLVLLKMLSSLDPNERLAAGQKLAKLSYKKFRKYLNEQSQKPLKHANK